MNQLPFVLSPQDFANLNATHPQATKGNSNPTGDRAREIIVLYFNAADPGCQIQHDKGHFSVTPKGKAALEFEVHGTKESNIALNQLIISGFNAHIRLTQQKIPLLRVIKVFDQAPEIWQLDYSTDYELNLETQPRWRGGAP